MNVMSTWNPMNPLNRLNPLSPVRRIAVRPRTAFDVGKGALKVRQAMESAGESLSEQIDRMEDYVDRTESRKLVGVGFAMMGIGIVVGMVLGGIFGRRAAEREEERRGSAGYGAYGGLHGESYGPGSERSGRRHEASERREET